MEEEITNLKLSSYIDIVSLREALGSAKSTLSILSFYAQSINTKFDEFRIAIDQINEKLPIGIICVQESWLHSNFKFDIFELRGYNMISKGKHCSEHGGLIIYVHDDFDYELFSVYENSNGWENLSIKIDDKKNSKKFVVGHCRHIAFLLNYQRIFRYSMENLPLETMRSHVYNQAETPLQRFFFENFVTAGYLPRITLPTRITDHSATLLDNIFTNVLEEHTLGFIINSISDHQMIYTYKNVEIQHTCTKSCTNRYIEIEKNAPHSIQNFVTKFFFKILIYKIN